MPIIVNQYILAKHPRSGLWYVCGPCGNGQYMPISQGYKNKKDAEKFRKTQPLIDYHTKVVGSLSV